MAQKRVYVDCEPKRCANTSTALAKASNRVLAMDESNASRMKEHDCPYGWSCFFVSAGFTTKEINMDTVNLASLPSLDRQIIEHALTLPDFEQEKLLDVMRFMNENPGSNRLLRKARIQGRCESWSEALAFMENENARIVDGGAA